MSILSRSRLALAALFVVALPTVARAQIYVETTVQEHQAHAGETYTTTLHVRNSSAETQEARLYVTDYRFFADGRRRFAEPGTTPRSNARWISVPERVTVPPHGEVPVQYSVAVPAGPTQAPGGTSWSTLMVEGIEPGSAESSRPSSRTRVAVGVRTTMRYAVQVVTHLPGGERRAEFTDAHVVRTPAGRAVELDITSTGSAAYRLTLTLELYDRQGRLAGRVTQQHGFLYPGCSIRQRFPLPTLPAGDYKAILLADTGTEDVFGAQYRLKL